MDQMIVEAIQTVENIISRPLEGSRRMSLVDLGKRLLEAAKRGETDTVRALMSNGAPFTTDWLGTSPLHFAAQYGHQETAEVLLRAGISRDARTKVDRTPLHVASQEGHLAIVQLLLQSNADIDAKDMLKMTPLHWSTEKGHVNIIATLIRNGADATLEDKFNRTPLDIAIANGRTDIAQLLQLHQDTSGVIEDSDAINIETSETLVTETVSTSDGVEGLVIDTDKLIKSEPDDSTDQSSTSVLATLAALAEATAPNSGNHTSTAEAMSWLESQGITMITTDGSLIASAVESGQTITLTEAGKIALNQFIQQEAGMHGVTEEDGEELEEVNEGGMGEEITEESIVEHGTGHEEGDVDDEEGDNVITIVTRGEEDSDEDVESEGQIIMEEAIIQEGHDGDITHVTDEDGNPLVIEEANGGMVGSEEMGEEETSNENAAHQEEGITLEEDELQLELAEENQGSE